MNSWFRRACAVAPWATVVIVIASCWVAAPAEADSDATAADLSALGCGGCHQLEEPPAEDRTLDAYTERKGPDLFYAGNKFRPEWLRAWLVQPSPIRPAGLSPVSRTTATANGDVVDEQAFDHPSVSPGDVDGVVNALATRVAGSDLIDPDAVQRTAVPRALAKLNFDKFKGCGTCHRTNDSTVPLSGPDLHRAYSRLRPEFLYSYIANPEQWDPVAPMPGYGLAPAEIGKLVEYLRILSEENEDAATR